MIFNSSCNRLKIPTILINAFIPSAQFFLFLPYFFRLLFPLCLCFFSPLLTYPTYLNTLNISLLKSLLFLLPSLFLLNYFWPIFLGSLFSCLSQFRDYTAWGGFQTPTPLLATWHHRAGGLCRVPWLCCCQHTRLPFGSEAPPVHTGFLRHTGREGALILDPNKWRSTTRDDVVGYPSPAAKRV